MTHSLTFAMLPDSNTQRGRRRLSVGFLAIFALFLTWNINHNASQRYSQPVDLSSLPTAKHSVTPEVPPSRKLAKVSMLYGSENTYYERALQSHQRHCERWGCTMYVLREEIAVGYWNKPNYLLSHVLRELAKPAEQRLEWLMYADIFSE